MMLILAACSSNGGEESAISTPNSSPRLTADYNDALPVQSQLAVGTLQLEDTDLAVDETQAAEILPLWRALQSLSNSDTTADAEVTAVVNQIQNMMKPEQISAIAEMQLTQESLTALIEDGTLSFGRGGGFGDETTNATTGGFAPPGDLPAGALGGGPGGGPGGGGFAGGGPGDGGGFPGGGFDGGQANLSEDDIATRQAGFESGGAGGFQDQAMTNAVIMLLETKTGEASEPVDPFADIWAILNEATGLTTEEIQTQTAAGQTLAELIVINGGDVETVKAELITALQESPLTQREDFDLETYVTDMLTNSGNNPGDNPDTNSGNND
jgi:hypothetical protein